MKLCSIEDCTNLSRARGWCANHYQRWRRYGEPDYPVEKRYNSPEEAFAARTEWQGACLVWTGGKDSDGYGRIQINYSSVTTHTYAWERENKDIPEGMIIDHRCHNRACVNTNHLRLVTRKQNSWNRDRNSSTNASGHKNIFILPSGNYRVGIAKDGKLHYYGVYQDLEEALEVRDQELENMFGIFSGKGIKWELSKTTEN